MALIKTIKGSTPQWGERCFLAENATLVGDVTMGDDCSIWFAAVLRADVDAIRMGHRVNVQDGVCIHQSTNIPVVIGNDVSIGHNAVVHGATIHDEALVGMGATVLDGAVVGKGAIVAAGALVLQNTIISDNEIWGGVPARFIKLTEHGQARFFADAYMETKQWYEP